MAGAGYKVVLSDLTSMTGTFHREAAQYRGLRQNVAPPVVSGGDGGLDHAVNEVADLIVALHTGFADRLDDHGDKVAYARDSFQRHDIDVHGLFEDLMTGEG
ncbi:DUF6317 family protein [Streptomyces sp. VRA16 Mangrove soil]|uniref:DUF6317 family protein n=1 Tax=Streptomyces sp. VRA16 Mangrove soil TaxID=2817434 RepID=UPI001A9E67E5|nr:DUF6317 family protein [Streptomyces sp. VRA16 Mangrove soil]MBO1335382.1 hypothetical protein [Streptomyces sp. VRA16 Mangrove soil]